jgi:hypothetical protein
MKKPWIFSPANQTRLVCTSLLTILLGLILAIPARADSTLTIDFVSTDTTNNPSTDVLQGNLIIDTTTNTLTGITNDSNGCCGFPDPSFTFADLNGGNPLFNVGDSVTASAVPGTSQTIVDSTTGVTFDWTSVTTDTFPCGACGGGVSYQVSYNGTGPGGGPNTIVIGGVVVDSFTVGDGVVEITGTASGTGGTGGTPAPEPATVWLLGIGLVIVAMSRRTLFQQIPSPEI